MRGVLLVCLLAVPVQAYSDPTVQKRLAVLEFTGPGFNDPEIENLTDIVRDEARKQATGYSVMTRESLLVLLQTNGKKLAECQGECEVETGRLVGADVVVSGSVLRFAGDVKVSLKMHATASAEFLSMAEAVRPTFKGLDEATRTACSTLFFPLLTESGGGKALFSVSRSVALPEVQIPKALEVKTINSGWNSVDVGALEFYDKVVRYDRSDATPEDKARKWEEFGRTAPAFSVQAVERAAHWRQYAIAQAEVEQARKRHIAAREADWAKLSRLLALEVISTEDKKKWADEFAAEYADREDESMEIEILRGLSPYLGVKPFVPSVLEARHAGSPCQTHRECLGTLLCRSGFCAPYLGVKPSGRTGSACNDSSECLGSTVCIGNRCE